MKIPNWIKEMFGDEAINAEVHETQHRMRNEFGVLPLDNLKKPNESNDSEDKSK